MKNLKSIYRKFNKHFLIIFIKMINPFFDKIGVYLHPKFSELKQYKLSYAKKTRRYLINRENKSFNKFFIDTSLSNTQLCFLGKKYPTNKSPLNVKGHRSGFTGIYTLLFSMLKNKKINIAEIGIEKNSSTKIWRDYFINSKIYAFEYDSKKIAAAKKNKLKNTFYLKTDVTKKKKY